MLYSGVLEENWRIFYPFIARGFILLVLLFSRFISSFIPLLTSTVSISWVILLWYLQLKCTEENCLQYALFEPLIILMHAYEVNSFPLSFLTPAIQVSKAVVQHWRLDKSLHCKFEIKKLKICIWGKVIQRNLYIRYAIFKYIYNVYMYILYIIHYIFYILYIL